MTETPELEGVDIIKDVKFIGMGWYSPAGGQHGIHIVVGNKKDFHAVGEQRIECLIKDMGLSAFMEKILECNKECLSTQYDRLMVEFDRQTTVREVFVRELQHLRDHLTGVQKVGGKWELETLKKIRHLEDAYGRVGKEEQHD